MAAQDARHVGRTSADKGLGNRRLVLSQARLGSRKDHIERVLKMAIEIGKQERADLEIVELATILHDIFQNREAHASIEGFRHEAEGSMEVRKILAKLGLANRTVDAVCHCIESHRKRSGRTEPQTIEAKCLFDADKLDCIGAIGTIRSAFVSFDHKQEFYKEVDDKKHSTGRNNHRPCTALVKLGIRA